MGGAALFFNSDGKSIVTSFFEKLIFNNIFNDRHADLERMFKLPVGHVGTITLNHDNTLIVAHTFSHDYTREQMKQGKRT